MQRAASYALVAALLSHVAPVHAQTSSARPIRFVAMGQVGGGVDFAARLIAPELSRALQQPVIVENRAGEVVPAEIVAKAPADGYTILMNGSSLLFLPFMRPNVPYDPVKSFAPITLAHQSPNVLVVYPQLTVKSVADLVALAKVKPGELEFASAGTGSSTHLAAQLFKGIAGVDVVHVPYKSSSAALTALIGGHVKFMFATPASAQPHIASGRLRAVAVTTLKPSALFPGLPTVAESGLPGYESISTNGVLAPAGTPGPIIDRLNREIVRILQTRDIKDKFFNAGSEVIGSTPQAFALVIRSELAKWGQDHQGGWHQSRLTMWRQMLSPCRRRSRPDHDETGNVAGSLKQLCETSVVEQWKFTMARVADPDRPYGTWYWSRLIDGAEVCSSVRGYDTLWECVKHAVLAGYDEKRMGPLDLSDSDVVVSQPVALGRRDRSAGS